MTLKVMPVVGVRPQLIKGAPILKILDGDLEVELQLVHTGQHYDYQMSKLFFKDLDLPEPARNLGIGQSVLSSSHAAQTALMLLAIEETVEDLMPDIVLVFGDANTTLAAALVATKMKVPACHIEAGLRSSDCYMAEEINRKLTDHCSQMLYAPTKTAYSNLCREGIDETKISLSGDTMYDMFLQHQSDIGESHVVNELHLTNEAYGVLTLHRPENVDDPENLNNIFGAIMELSETLKFVLPIHPRLNQVLTECYQNIPDIFDVNGGPVKTAQPLGYFDFLNLLKHANVVVTDSGGVQKEAHWTRVPCVTLRETTEWPETVLAGANVLAGNSKKRITETVRWALKRKPSQTAPNIYGDGHASQKIVNHMKQRFSPK